MVRVGTRGSSFRLNDRARNDCYVDPPRGSGRHHPVDRSPGLHHIADVMLVLHANLCLNYLRPHFGEGRPR